jgi:hypothetical protein
MSIYGIWWLTGNIVADPPDPYARIRTLEAELTQARADARVLAAEVQCWRDYDKQSEYGFTDEQWTAYCESKRSARKATDASGALERNKA